MRFGSYYDEEEDDDEEEYEDEYEEEEDEDEDEEKDERKPEVKDPEPLKPVTKFFKGFFEKQNIPFIIVSAIIGFFVSMVLTKLLHKEPKMYYPYPHSNVRYYSPPIIEIPPEVPESQKYRGYGDKGINYQFGDNLNEEQYKQVSDVFLDRVLENVPNQQRKICKDCYIDMKTGDVKMVKPSVRENWIIKKDLHGNIIDAVKDNNSENVISKYYNKYNEE